MKLLFNGLAMAAEGLVNFNVSTNCFMFFYQPQVPKKLIK
ncbi:cyclic lactone autoinducer peptide [Alkaliphilus crotonatoxidans]